MAKSVDEVAAAKMISVSEKVEATVENTITLLI